MSAPSARSCSATAAAFSPAPDRPRLRGRADFGQRAARPSSASRSTGDGDQRFRVIARPSGPTNPASPRPPPNRRHPHLRLRNHRGDRRDAHGGPRKRYKLIGSAEATGTARLAAPTCSMTPARPAARASSSPRATCARSSSRNPRSTPAPAADGPARPHRHEPSPAPSARISRPSTRSYRHDPRLRPRARLTSTSNAAGRAAPSTCT